MTLRSCAAAVAAATLLGNAFAQQPEGLSLREQKDLLMQELDRVHNLTEEQSASVRAVLMGSRYIGQGNPAITVHPATAAECRAQLEGTEKDYGNAEFERICGAKYMSPLYDPETGTAGDARACIDQFEFPNIPCTFPVVWVRAREAALICEAMDKRLCDAHEWEGACAGSLHQPDYRFDLAAGIAPNLAVSRMRAAHNAADAGKEIWSYGPDYRKGVCAAASAKSRSCDGGGWAACGSNTYPTGFFPECRSELGVYDLHGNAAEHMNLPLDESQMTSRGSRELGHTEMKGSWFIFDSFRAHPDQCRWRAPYWHGSRVMDPDSHHNYHLGFRCCNTLPSAAAEDAVAGE
jgi:formylglycine-generating enzyme required for sulfatase activity